MGSNAVNLVEEDLCCPVCKKPLSSPGTPPKPKVLKLGREKGRAPHLQGAVHAQRDKRMAVGRLKDNEEIVIAQCGHLYHKFCLRHFCYLVREGRSNHMDKVSCPLCNRQISMSSQTIDYRAHQDRPNDRDREFTKTNIMNNELSGQVATVQQRLQRVGASIEDGNHNFEIYRSHWRKLRKELKGIKTKRLDIENLYKEIDRSEQMLKCMQRQQLKIVKKFMLKARDKAPKDYIHFPRRLAPFLQYIEEDDRLVRDLGEIIVPIHLNHLKSDRQSLLKGIIATVHEKMMAQEKAVELSEAVTPKHVHQKSAKESMKKPEIFVKVRKSSISILSSMSLSKDSIQQIMKSVDVSLPVPRTSRKLTKRPKEDKPQEKVSNNKLDNVSTSDIKILYMPKRKMVQTSEPCRNIEESDSLAKVPARKCKSTDAVLVKTKKKQGSGITSKVRQRGSRSVINVRRSSTEAVQAIPPETQNVNDFIRSQNKTCPTLGNTSKYESAPASTRSSYSEGFMAKAPKEEASADIDMSKTYDSSLSEWVGFNLPTKAEQQRFQMPDFPLNNLNEKASLLKLIYEKLEEDQQSSYHLEAIRKAGWTDHDENNNLLFPDISKNNCFPSLSQEPQPILPLFRVDRRGIARPESPHLSFRQPSFLCHSIDPSITEKYLFSTLQPDEENQLNSLSSEEKFLVAAELEAFFAARRNCGGAVRRPMFHGIPACLGMPEGKYHFGTPPDPCVPFYLKKWQQQLPSRNVFKEIPGQRQATTANCSKKSSRLLHLPHDGCRTPRYRIAQGGPQTLSSLQQQPEVSTIHLPPLSMYPSKRPTTAVCEKLPRENYQHMEGPEREAYKITDFKNNFWK